MSDPGNDHNENRDLLSRIAKARSESTTLDKKPEEIGNGGKDDSENMRIGLQTGTEFVADTIGGGFIGWLLDNWLGTSPWLLILFLLLGLGAGFMNVYKLTQGAGTSVGFAGLHQKKKQAKQVPGKK